MPPQATSPSPSFLTYFTLNDVSVRADEKPSRHVILHRVAALQLHGNILSRMTMVVLNFTGQDTPHTIGERQQRERERPRRDTTEDDAQSDTSCRPDRSAPASNAERS